MPNRLVTSGNPEPLTLVKSSAGPPAAIDAAMDLGGFEVGIDRRLHRDEVAVTAKLVEKRAEIGERHDGRARSGLAGPASRLPIAASASALPP